MTIPANILTAWANGNCSEALELLAIDDRNSLVVMHEAGEYKGKAFNNWAVRRAWLDQRYAAWQFSYQGCNIPAGHFDRYLVACAAMAVERGLITAFTAANGAVISKGKITNGHANGSGKANGAAPPFDGGTFQKGKVTPPAQAATVTAAKPKAPRKRSPKAAAAK